MKEQVEVRELKEGRYAAAANEILNLLGSMFNILRQKNENNG